MAMSGIYPISHGLQLAGDAAVGVSVLEASLPLSNLVC